MAISSAVYSTRGMGSPLQTGRVVSGEPSGRVSRGRAGGARSLGSCLLHSAGTWGPEPVTTGTVLVTEIALALLLWSSGVGSGSPRALLLVLERDLRDQLPALAVRLVRETLARECPVCSGGCQVPLPCPPPPSLPAPSLPATLAGCLGAAAELGLSGSAGSRQTGRRRDAPSRRGPGPTLTALATRTRTQEAQGHQLTG